MATMLPGGRGFTLWSPPVPGLTSQTAVAEGVAVIALAGELDLAGTGALESDIERVLAHARPDTVVLDLRDLAFMDSSGLRVIAAFDARARSEGDWRFVLVRGRPAVHRVFEITRLVDRLDFVDAPVWS
jgi:anti-sigma B factor antagonist